jgi:MFS transporter, DHA1 family, multidrug resistance protein
MTSRTDDPGNPHPGLSFRAFVAMVAAMMALNALAIDSMLPALPQIGRSAHIANENDQQWIITAYLLGFGAAQIFHGPLSDRFGRRPVLISGLAAYVVFTLICTLTNSFLVLVISRGLQGIGSAASRVVAVSLVRDCYSGRQMARVMSLAFIVFLLVPILAPSIGQLVLLVASWRLIFGLLALFGIILLIWVALRLPETLPPERRLGIRPSEIVAAWRVVVSDRSSVGYTIAMTVMQGGLFGFLNSVQQIMSDDLHKPAALPFVFASIGGCMAIGSFLNSRIVERVGTRRVSHTAIFGVLAIAATHLLVSVTGHETVYSFALLQGLTMLAFALCSANFGAMAMENLGSVAGAAASLQGFTSTVLAALLGFAIGQNFDGTTVPLTAGMTLATATAIIVVLITERGRLFRPHHPAPSPAPSTALSVE